MTVIGVMLREAQVRSQTGRQAVVVIALGILLALAACTPKDAATPSNGRATSPSLRAPSATPSLDVRAAAAQGALDAYRSMWAAYEEAGQSADPDHPGLSQYAVGSALQTLTSGLRSVRDRGLVIRGEITLAPQMNSLSPADRPTKAEIRDCADDSKSLLYKRSGELFNDKVGGSRLVIATVEDTGGGVWKVSSFGVREVGTC